LSGRIVSSVWYRFAWTVREPTSYRPAGSRDAIVSVVDDVQLIRDSSTSVGYDHDTGA